MGTTLTPRMGIMATDGSHIFVMQDDGNAVVYNTQTGLAIWATGTNGTGTAPYKFVFQTDGNMCVYDNTDSAKWCSGTNGKVSSSAHLSVGNNGNLCLTGVWCSGSNGK